ncbi:YHYH domain-containing protein [Priestia megaterium]|nr:YHYH domain-containing protein [Priestia megaterium]
MKGIFKVAIFTFLFLLSCLFTKEITFAHPGRTDEDGGHTCYTNCEEWGLEYGEYHYHDEPEEEEEGYEEPEESDDTADLSPIEIVLILGVCIGFWLLVWWIVKQF